MIRPSFGFNTEYVGGFERDRAEDAKKAFWPIRRTHIYRLEATSDAEGNLWVTTYINSGSEDNLKYYFRRVRVTAVLVGTDE